MWLYIIWNNKDKGLIWEHFKEFEAHMSEIRLKYNPTITQLLREHDRIPYENVSERMSLQRRILHLMNTVKLLELENSFA